jgi:hypothetical protein
MSSPTFGSSIARWAGGATREPLVAGRSARQPSRTAAERVDDGHSGAAVRRNAQWACIDGSDRR